MKTYEYAVYRVDQEPINRLKVAPVFMISGASMTPEEQLHYCEMERDRLLTLENDGFSNLYQVLHWYNTYQFRASNGVGFNTETPEELRGDMHHLINPVIGFLSLDERDGDFNIEKFSFDRVEGALRIFEEYVLTHDEDLSEAYSAFATAVHDFLSLKGQEESAENMAAGIEILNLAISAADLLKET